MHTHTHTLSVTRTVTQNERQPHSVLVEHKNEGNRREMSTLSQRGAWGVLQASEQSEREAWQLNAPSVDSSQRTAKPNGKRWAPQLLTSLHWLPPLRH